MKRGNMTDIERKVEVLNAITSLNKLIISGENHPNVIQADFLINTWWDSVNPENSEEHREP